MPEQLPAFQAQQYRFAAHIRDPDHHPAPPDVEDRRMQIYRELFYNNIESFLCGGFPVLRTLYPDADWHALVRSFYSTHVSHSPQFYQIAGEFLDYLQNEHGMRDCDPPFLLELAHYEWVEMILAIDPAEIDMDGMDAEGDLLDGVPVLNPCLRNLAYQYPVHKISADYRPEEPGGQPSCLVVYRKPDDEVAFLEVNAVTSRLLQRIEADPQRSGREQLLALADEAGLNAETVLEFGAQTLADLRQKGVILGVKA